ncbi:hypothetical protein FIBSPDRAFT_724360, partial [Athelia psychrophila]
VGAFLSLILFGILQAQAFTYWRNCEKDGLWMKLFIGILVTLDALNSAFTIAWMYKLLIDSWGDMTPLLVVDWLAASQPITAGVIQCLVQLFFVRRLHYIAGQNWLTCFILVCVLLTVVGSVGGGIAIFLFKEYARLSEIQWISEVWGVAATIADISITVAMTHHLRRAKGNFVATDRVLDRIIHLTLQNGFLMSFWALLNTCLWVFVSLYYNLRLIPHTYSPLDS